MFSDDCFRDADLLASKRKRLLRDRLQRIDVVKINAFHFIYVWMDVTRHRDINNEERTVDAIAQHRRETFRRKQRRFRSCRCNQDIDLAALLQPFIESNSPSGDETG